MSVKSSLELMLLLMTVTYARLRIKLFALCAFWEQDQDNTTLKTGLTNMTGFYDPIKKSNVPLFNWKGKAIVSGTCV